MHVTLYGGFAEKGRTSIGVESGGYRLLLDAGVNTSARRGAGYYPALDADALRALDAMIVTHAHEDHVAALGWCIAHGFRGRIFMTRETRQEIAALHADYAHPAHAALVHDAAVENLPIGDGVLGLGPFGIATGRSGHVAGGVWCVVDDGRTRLAYCGDVAPASPVFAMDALPPCTLLVIDASYGDDAIGAGRRAADIAQWTAARPEGCVLPTPLFGRSAELLAIVPGPLALAPGMRDALQTQLDAAAWLVDGARERLLARLAQAGDWQPGTPLPRAALLCHDGMGLAGASPAILDDARAAAHPVLFTGHLPTGSPGARMVADQRAAWIRLPTHPTLADNVALAAATGASVVIGHSCDREALLRLAQHVPNLRTDLATGDAFDA
jgi:glyoxylase-like metal-dependent hydrolase (beta-lactamase superfamily II)